MLFSRPAWPIGLPLPQPDRGGDKEERGRVLVIAGSVEVPGAALLAEKEGVVSIEQTDAGRILAITSTEQDSWALVLQPGWEPAQVTGAFITGYPHMDNLEWRKSYAVFKRLPAMRKQKDGCINNVASWAGRHVSKMPGPAYTTTKHAVLALTHSFNMDECVNGLRACCLSPGEVATPILKLRPVVPSEEEQAKMLQPEDCGRTIAFVASMPPRVCMNEILISPTHNRGFIQTPANRD